MKKHVYPNALCLSIISGLKCYNIKTMIINKIILAQNRYTRNWGSVCVGGGEELNETRIFC